jgi:hypothetical protein
MPPKQGKGRTVFCGIGDYIRLKNPIFWDAIEALCMSKLVIPGKFSPGVAFIYPEESFLQKLIVKSMSPDDEGGERNVSQAMDWFKSLIIPDNIQSGDDAKAKVIGNRLLVTLPIDRDQTKKDKIVFSNGCVIEKDKEFHAIPKHNNISVWIATKGSPATEGEPYTAPRGVKGGSVIVLTVGEKMARTKRRRIATDLELDFQKNPTILCEPYLVAVSDLLNYLYTSHLELFKQIYPLLDPCPLVTFYLLVQPYRNIEHENGWIISHDVIDDWKYRYTPSTKIQEIKASYRTLFESTIADRFTEPGAIASTYNYYTERKNRVLTDLQRSSTIKDIRNEVEDAIKNVTHDYLKLSMADKTDMYLWICEFRYILRAIVLDVLELKADPVYKSVTDIFDHVKCVQPGDDFVGERIYTVSSMSSIVDEEQQQSLKRFIKSFDFPIIPFVEDIEKTSASLFAPDYDVDESVVPSRYEYTIVFNRITVPKGPEPPAAYNKTGIVPFSV